MSEKAIEMAKIYNPQATEGRLYAWWEAQGYFKPETGVELGLADPDAPAWWFCIVWSGEWSYDAYRAGSQSRH